MNQNARCLVSAIAVAAALLVAPGTAGAATAALGTNPVTGATELSYVAGPGEANDLTISFTDHLVITDVGVAEITDADGPGGCAASGNVVTCPEGLDPAIRVLLGDLDDRLVSQGPTRQHGLLTVDAGSGDDVLQGGSEPDLFMASPGADEMLGGGSLDTVSYEDRENRVVVTIDEKANDGFPGERDNVGIGIDRIVGTPRADRLVGSFGRQLLVGGRGRDVLLGRSGRDFLDGGREDDTLRGGSDDDELLGRKGNDQLVGGSGDDRLSGGASRDSLRGGSGEDRLNGGIHSDRCLDSDTPRRRFKGCERPRAI
jgi:Ca2+-binding RTX toxin-like protein